MDFKSIAKENAEYPPLLRETPGAPNVLHVRGRLPSSSVPAIAIVGTRKATRDGKEIAHSAAVGLARAGFVIVSGLAMGIDSAAHRGALDAGGITIAVLGNGIDSIYPAQNQSLAKQILKSGGAVISEYGPDEPSFKGRFIERNRIISGLSVGVVVVEAPERSGAISTARFAGEQGREVFVYPGAAGNKHYAGSHALIRDGAILVTGVPDILHDLGVEGRPEETTPMRALTPDEHKVTRAISDAGKPLGVDMIAELTTLEPHMVSRIITNLLVEDVIKDSGAGYELSNR